jgi:hypothetical protein
MVTGELIHSDPNHDSAGHGGHGAEPARTDQEPPYGSAVVASGRTSSALDVGAQPEELPVFSPAQLARLDEALTLVSRHAKLRFSIYLGDLGSDSTARANELFDQLGAAEADSVLIAVDPGHRKLDIITGHESAKRLSHKDLSLAVMGMVSSFKEGDLHGGLLSGLQTLSEQAGTAS